MGDLKVNEVHIYLMFYDFDFQPKEISKLLNLEPTMSGIEGEEYYLSSKRKSVYKSNRWEFRRDYEIGKKWVQEFIDDFIVEIIEPREKEIRDIMSKGDGEFSVVPYFYSEANPGFFFEKKTIKILSEASLPLNLDIYSL